MLSRSIRCCFFGLFTLLGFVGSPLAQTANVLIVGDGAGAPGDTGVSVSVSMDNIAPIGGLQFDLAPPPGVTLMSGATNMTRAPSHTVSTGSANPPTILMFTISTDVIAPGTGEIATLLFDVDPTASPAVWNFSVSGVVLSDPVGVQLPGSGTAGHFEILGAGDDDDSAGDDDDDSVDDDDDDDDVTDDDDDDSAGDDDDSAGDDDDSVGDDDDSVGDDDDSADDDDDSADDDDDSVGDDDDSVGDDDDSAIAEPGPECSCESASLRAGPGAWALLPIFAALGRRRRR